MFTVKGRIWIENENGPFVGYGRVVLLEKIKETGSITEAARQMKMSYRQAWELVDEMNKKSKKPLVERIIGGKGGGGTKVTSEGEKLIRNYWKLHNNFVQFNESEAQKLEF